jgi:hypothetical protein
MEAQLRQSAFPRQSVLAHIEYARRAPLRAIGLFSALGLASGLGYALALAVAMALGAMVSATNAKPAPPTLAAAEHPGLDPSRFILNALLAPALDANAVPLRWVDPRPAMHCGPGSTVRVNGRTLRAGEPVPETPFELDWWADGCRPFGAAGPRFDGGVKLTVFREDWGFSSMVEPRGLRVASAEGETEIQRVGATMPQCTETDRPLSCR